MQRRGALLAALMGVLGATVAVLLLGLRFRRATSVVYGFGFGVAVVGLVLAVGMVAWTYVSDADGEDLYIYPATVTSASVLMLVAADNLVGRESHSDLSLLLVGAAVLVIVGFSLVFVVELRVA